VRILHRNHRAAEISLLPGDGRAFLAFDRVFVALRARAALRGRDQVGGYALRHEIGFERDREIDRPGPARSADADAAHGLDATTDRHVVLPGHDLRGGEIHRVEARRAEAV